MAGRLADRGHHGGIWATAGRYSNGIRSRAGCEKSLGAGLSGWSRLWASTDAALAAFEDELYALKSPSDSDVLDVVKDVVLALNEINEQHVNTGQTGYETDEREELCDYIDASLEESGIDVES